MGRHSNAHAMRDNASNSCAQFAFRWKTDAAYGHSARDSHARPVAGSSGGYTYGAK